EEEEEDPEIEEEEDDPEMEEEEEEMDVDADEEGDGLEWMLPYEGTDPLNPPPPGSDSESEIEEAAPMLSPPILADHEPEAEVAIIGTGRLVPLTGRRLFTNTQVRIGSSSSTVAGHDPEDLTPSHIRSDLNALHRRDLDCVTWHHRHLRYWSFEVQRHLTPHLHYQETPYVAPTVPVIPVAHDDLEDPYVAARDATTVPVIDDDDPTTHEETLPSEP
ncbi:hypothetical protein Tco_0204008, partial [Tanacetum coccineum]